MPFNVTHVDRFEYGRVLVLSAERNGLTYVGLCSLTKLSFANPPSSYAKSVDIWVPVPRWMSRFTIIKSLLPT